MASPLDFLKRIGQAVVQAPGEIAAFKRYGPDFRNILEFEEFERERARGRAPLEDDLLRAQIEERRGPERQLSRERAARALEDPELVDPEQRFTQAQIGERQKFTQAEFERRAREARERDEADPVKRFQRQQAEEGLASSRGMSKEEEVRFNEAIRQFGAIPRDEEEDPRAKAEREIRSSMANAMDLGEPMFQPGTPEEQTEFERRMNIRFPKPQAQGPSPDEVFQNETAKANAAFESGDPAAIEEIATSIISGGATEVTPRAQEAAYKSARDLFEQGLTEDDVRAQYPGLLQLAEQWAQGLERQGLPR